METINVGTWQDRPHSLLTLFFSQNSLLWRHSEAATGLMVAIHLVALLVVVVGTLSITLDKARLFILSGILMAPIENISLEYKCCRKITDGRDQRSESDKLIAVHGEVSDADPALLLDKLSHGLQLLPADVDELPPVVNDPGQQPVLLQLVNPLNGFLGLQLELSCQVFQQHNLAVAQSVLASHQ